MQISSFQDHFSIKKKHKNPQMNTVEYYFHIWEYKIRGIIDSKAGKAAALQIFFIYVNPISIKGADYAQPLALPHLKNFVITPLKITACSSHIFLTWFLDQVLNDIKSILD